jgi:hypothetical protein
MKITLHLIDSNICFCFAHYRFGDSMNILKQIFYANQTIYYSNYLKFNKQRLGINEN